MRQDLTQRDRSQNRKERRSVVSTLAFLAFVLLGMCGAQTAHAQNFTIERNNPVNAADFENVSPVFNVRLTGGDPNVTYAVNVSTTDGTAQAGADYYALGTTVSFKGAGTGSVATTVTVGVIDDGSDELDENFTIALSNPSAGANANTNPVNYIIRDNDNPPIIRIRDISVGDTGNGDAPDPQPSGEARFVEGSNGTNNSFTFTIELLSGGTNAGKARVPERLIGGALGPLVTSYQTINFNYDFLSGNGTDPTAIQMAPDSATLGTDFTGPAGGTGAASIAALAHTTTIPFFVVGDNQDENNESFIARVLSPTNVTNTQGTFGYGVILDDDAPNVTISPVTVTEGAPGTTNIARFVVELSRPSIQPLKIDYFTKDRRSVGGGTANSNVPGLPDPNTVPDFVGQAGTLTFGSNVTQQFIDITVNGDNITENDETFTVTLTPNPGTRYDNFVFIPETATRGLTFTNGGVATGTILNDDTSQITITDASPLWKVAALRVRRPRSPFAWP